MISLSFTNLDTPKSHILTSPSDVKRILSNFMSLCKMHLEWLYFNPSIIYLNTCFATSSFSFLLLLTYVNRSPAPQSSITNTICDAVSKDSYSLTILICLVLLRILNSCITFFLEDSSLRNYLFIDFNATNFSDSLWTARLTFPKAPLPITLPIL